MWEISLFCPYSDSHRWFLGRVHFLFNHNLSTKRQSFVAMITSFTTLCLILLFAYTSSSELVQDADHMLLMESTNETLGTSLLRGMDKVCEGTQLISLCLLF